jgi:hypothetical protein
MDRAAKPRRDNAGEAMKIMGDISIPFEEAEKRVHALIRRMKPAKQVFVIGMGLRFRNEALQRKEGN